MKTQTGMLARGRAGRGLALGFAGLLILLLDSCAELDLASGSGDQASDTSEAAQSLQNSQPAGQAPLPDGNIDPKMEPAPEVFRAKDFAVWNEAQTLPGIWIAHPDADAARRVRVTNDETGAQTDAAMFRRDASLSGPRIILSAEIAESLDLIPGHATPVTIEALAYRTPAEPESANVADTTGPESAAETGEPAKPLDEPLDADAEAGSQETAADTATHAAEPTEASPVEDSALPEPVIETSAVEVPAVEEDAKETGEPANASPPAAGPPVEGAVPEDDSTALDEPEDAGAAGVEVAPASDPSADPEPDESRDVSINDAASPAPPPARPRVEEPAAGDDPDITDGRTFIQAGIFSQAQNAARLVEKLRAAGLTAIERPLTLGERQFTRVLVGPYDTVAERDAALRTVREVGPADATPAKG